MKKKGILIFGVLFLLLIYLFSLNFTYALKPAKSSMSATSNSYEFGNYHHITPSGYAKQWFYYMYEHSIEFNVRLLTNSSATLKVSIDYLPTHWKYNGSTLFIMDIGSAYKGNASTIFNTQTFANPDDSAFSIFFEINTGEDAYFWLEFNHFNNKTIVTSQTFVPIFLVSSSILLISIRRKHKQ